MERCIYNVIPSLFNPHSFYVQVAAVLRRLYFGTLSREYFLEWCVKNIYYTHS